jgi:hypothetical protein
LEDKIKGYFVDTDKQIPNAKHSLNIQLIMKAITLLISIIFLNLVTTPNFDRFINRIHEGWSAKIDNNKLVISKDSLVKIEYFNYGMQADPPVLDHKFEIVIEYTKRLKVREIERRKNQRDSLLKVYSKNYETEPTKTNWAKYEMIRTKLNTNKKYRIPFYSNDQYSYFIQDNFPNGYRCIKEAEKEEIDSLICKLKNES